MIQQAIAKIVDKQDLSYDEAYAVMSEIMNGETTQTQNAAFLAALSTKSTKAETIDEISGCAAAMRERAIPVAHPGMEVLEIVGTGGDGAHSFNISTTSALVLAAAGFRPTTWPTPSGWPIPLGWTPARASKPTAARTPPRWRPSPRRSANSHNRQGGSCHDQSQRTLWHPWRAVHPRDADERRH